MAPSFRPRRRRQYLERSPTVLYRSLDFPEHASSPSRLGRRCLTPPSSCQRESLACPRPAQPRPRVLILAGLALLCPPQRRHPHTRIQVTRLEIRLFRPSRTTTPPQRKISPKRPCPPSSILSKSKRSSSRLPGRLAAQPLGFFLPHR